MIGIDFVGPLSKSKDRDSVYNSLTVIINHLTGMVRLVPSYVKYKALEVAEVVFAEIYKLHAKSNSKQPQLIFHKYILVTLT